MQLSLIIFLIDTTQAKGMAIVRADCRYEQHIFANAQLGRLKYSTLPGKSMRGLAGRWNRLFDDQGSLQKVIALLNPIKKR